MKNFLLFTAILFYTSASAQYNMRNNARTITDADRQMMQQQSKSKKTEKPDVIELSMQKLNEDLKLDSFQSAVIKQLLEENKKKEDKIIEEDIPNESKIEKITALRLELNDKIKGMLNADQIELFDKMQKKKKKK